MDNNTRKASDILLELEAKIDILLNIIRVQDLNIKVLSNKLNSVMDTLKQNSTPPVISAVDQKLQYQQMQQQLVNQIPISNEYNIEIDNSPKGYSRTSRQETYIEQKSPAKQEIKKEAEIIVPTNNFTDPDIKVNDITPPKGYTIPVIQRVVDKNGKSIFMADVEVFDSIGNTVIKVRTNGSGKWQTSLQAGTYKVVIKKKALDEKDRVEISQNITVDKNSSKLELPQLIIK